MSLRPSIASVADSERGDLLGDALGEALATLRDHVGGAELPAQVGAVMPAYQDDPLRAAGGQGTSAGGGFRSGFRPDFLA